MLSDTKTNNLRIVLHQIYVNLYVEYGRCSCDMRKAKTHGRRAFGW